MREHVNTHRRAQVQCRKAGVLHVGQLEVRVLGLHVVFELYEKR